MLILRFTGKPLKMSQELDLLVKWTGRRTLDKFLRLKEMGK